MNVQVKPEIEKKIRQGYPWIFQNEIGPLPQGFRNGSCIDFVNRKNEFLAFGYLNSQSKISGRVLTLDSSQKSLTRPSSLSSHLLQCWEARKQRGFRGSFRLCYGESDQLPGLVIDYYLLKNNHQVLVIQISTLGMEILFASYLEILKDTVTGAHKKGLTPYSWDETSIVLRNDLNVRKYEGLDNEIPRVIQTKQAIDLPNAEILVNDVHGPGTIALSADLYQGQKTGFFLDQVENIRRVVQFLEQRPNQTEPFRILDLCCYVGHWSTQIAHFFQKKNQAVHCHLVDVSEKALSIAEKNVKPWAAEVVVSKIDVLKGLDALHSESYDLVIADPPAFIKSKKDIAIGQHAYAKLNSQAFRLVKKGGLVVSCSCSGLLTEDLFRESLQKAFARSQGPYQQRAQLILKGSMSADHPSLVEFPESNYLKMFMHQMNF